MKLISVIIPTYKPSEYLWECLDSLVLQSFPKKDFEVILVLNGCKEPWKSEIENYIATKMQGMSVNFIHTEKGGVCNARNIALDNAKGEYITFIDDDDYISNNYLEELLKHSNSYGCIGVCRILAFSDNNILYKIPTDYNYYYKKKETNKLYLLSSFFSGPTVKLYHRSVITDRRFDVRFKNGEDALFNFLISDKIKRVSFASSSAIYYRRVRDGSASTAAYNTKIYRIKNCLRLIFAYSTIYFRSPLRYSILFYITRILATMKGLIYNLL